MRALRWAAIATVAVVLAAVLVGFAGVATIFAPSPAAAADCSGNPGANLDVAQAKGLSADQSRNAATIIGVGKRLGVPERGWVIAVAVAYQESTLINVDHGDDWWFGGAAGSSPSRGLFQQMPVYYAGVDVMVPEQATEAFYRRLVGVEGWETMPLWAAGQAVQHSAFPREYQKHEPLAQRLVGDLAGVTVSSPTCRATTAATGDWALPLPADKVHAPVAEHWRGVAVDLPLSPGERQPVYAMTAGTATPMEEPAGCGHGVYVRAGGDEWLYCHLSTVQVDAGQQVTPGVQLGISGWSGHTDPPDERGAHLHIQLARGGRKVCVQPVIDALKAGQVPPALDQLPTPTGATCLSDWAARAT
jgi:murein DD-endopeptidase MepM/ murein hydrolase activator NlpD